MEARNPKYTKNGLIDIELNHPDLGWIPFTAHPTDLNESTYDIVKEQGTIKIQSLDENGNVILDAEGNPVLSDSTIFVNVKKPITCAEIHAAVLSGQFGAITPYVDPPVDMSAVRLGMNVTRFQALAALDSAGLLPQVEAIMLDPATPNITKLAWENALEFKRMSPTVIALGQTLGLTDTQLDDLFTQAKNIEA